MKKSIVTLFLIFGLIPFLNAQSETLEQLLYELPDVIFTKIETPDNFEAAYELKIKQPLDHKNPSKGHFYQRAYLSHKDFKLPTVMITEGYTANSNRVDELTHYIDANQIRIEHRYFGKSNPAEIDYQYLTLEQVAADLHHINTLFRNLYPTKWVSTGRSKGGATTLFYRYFYPDDVDVSVNYVGPINKSFEEQRIYKFLDTVGTAECRKKIEKFQRHVLENKDEILPLMKAYSVGAKASFTYQNIEKAFEFSVMEYPFSFWQYGSDCDLIPNDKASAYDSFLYLIQVSDITFFSDQTMTDYASHYYQSANEFGYYGYDTSKFKGLLDELPTDKNPHAAFTPNHMKVPFNDKSLKALNAWLPKHGNKIIHIYGTLDTWSASAVPKSEKVDALWFMMNGKHHGNANITEMTPNEREKLTKALERWLSIKLGN